MAASLIDVSIGAQLRAKERRFEIRLVNGLTGVN